MLCVAEEREKLRTQVVEAMSEGEIQKQAALQGMEIEQGEEGRKADTPVGMEVGDNDENKEVVGGMETSEPGEKVKDGTGPKAKDSSVLKERSRNESGELNKKVAEIAIDVKPGKEASAGEGDEMEEGAEDADQEGDSSTC